MSYSYGQTLEYLAYLNDHHVPFAAIASEIVALANGDTRRYDSYVGPYTFGVRNDAVCASNRQVRKSIPASVISFHKEVSK